VGDDSKRQICIVTRSGKSRKWKNRDDRKLGNDIDVQRELW
jgi:hypothetical protein